jgi:hypothetical protein
MKLLIFTFIIFISVFINSNEAGAIIICPSKFDIQTEAGIAQKLKVTVYNNSPKKYNVKTYSQDLVFNEKGIKLYKEPGNNPYSISSFINFSEKQFILEPKERKIIYITVNIPDSIIGGNRTIAFFHFSAVVPKYLKNITKVAVETRVAVPIYQETTNSVILKSSIKQVGIKLPDSSNPLQVELKVKNEGNTNIYSTGKVSIINSDDQFLGNFMLDEKMAFPGREVTLKCALHKNFSPGRYFALISYYYRDKIITVNKPFVMK